MVGLSVVLEAHKGSSSSSSSSSNNKKTPHVINKTTMMLTTNQHHDPFPASAFLHHCFLCNKRLLPGKDIYMYKGDRAFCSVDCRCKQILTDEEEAIDKDNCSLAPRHHRKGARNQP